MTARTCGASYKRTLSRRFRRWIYDGGAYIRAMCLWCYVHLAQAGVMNNYTRVLYIQGACIFMHGGGYGMYGTFGTFRGRG